MKNAKLFLDLCARWFPSTRKHTSHTLSFKDDRLILTLNLGDTTQSFNFDEADLEKTPFDLLADVSKLYQPPARAPKSSSKKTPDDIA
jgi:hypothetical protein